MEIGPEAFDAFPSGTYQGQLSSMASTDLEALNGSLAPTGPFVRVDDPPKFELESYIANYTGRTRFNRLFLIGTCSTYLSVEALKAAIAEAKAGKDVARYERAVRALAEAAPNEAEAVPDADWMNHQRKVVKVETDRLEHELRGYKNNLIKESIRMGNEDLGHHYHQIGDLVAASKAYSRMRDFCTTPTHIASMLFKIINVGIERGDWLSVQSNVQRLRNMQSKQEEQSKNQPKMSAAMGLSQMHSGSYLEAANSFLDTEPSLGDSYNEVITSNDVAVYGGLCALASMDRLELQRRVLENNAFRNFLELEPHIRRAISFFCSSKFRPCLEILESYKTDYLLDIHLQRHVSTLFTQIRTKSIQQYLVPFSRVTLDSMSKIFAPGVASGQTNQIDSSSPFVQELITLIQDGTLEARIDLEKMVLVSNQVDLRMEVQQAALNSLESYLQEAHLRLLRTNMIRSGLEVRPLEERRHKTEERSAKSTGLGGRIRGVFQ
ncbi:putative COP9 signalosome subunit 1 [Aspergillus campestris IBT 28561]|uniref:COP9 signalosome complex subunit 1 n=1 Tax=Aspergillus campestris (strain IBT 28561) TaxID=1392248 RepID=A0A2I1DAS0_ASPC2|nr:putative COP9 signalosome subunit 1 [Aspergillus campestris IBT 28561]PKY06977.1 putative COP9 signalosome subunit 1 [Aspergillus campestris IBT 28561]